LTKFKPPLETTKNQYCFWWFANSIEGTWANQKCGFKKRHYYASQQLIAFLIHYFSITDSSMFITRAKNVLTT